MSLRIGLITGEFPPMEGGVGAFTLELARALAAAGHFVAVITDQKARPAEMPRSFMDPFPLVDTEFGQMYPHIHRWRWGSNGRIVQAVDRFELDVVNIQYQAAAYNMRSAAVNLLPWRLKGVLPTVVTFHDLRVPYLFPKAGRLRQMAVNQMAKRAHGVIATNPADYAALQPLQTDPSRLVQIPIGSNINATTPPAQQVAAVRQALGLTVDDCLLGYFGFVNESKGADTLVAALAQLDSRFHLVFIGGRTGSSDTANNATFAAQLDARIAELGLEQRVHWTGFLDDTAVSSYLHAADMMVLPYKDGASLRRGTLMAALAHGRPLLTTQPTTPTPELRHDDNARFVPVDVEAAALAQAVGQLADDRTALVRLAQGATAVADLFTWDKIAAETAVFFEQLVDAPASNP